MGDCANSATDCKEAASYAQYNFEKGRESEAREYVRRLEEHLSRLKGHLAQLDYSHTKSQ